MERLTRFALRHKALVALLLLAGFLLGLAATPLVVDRISEEYRYPGMPSYEANRAIVATYGSGGYQRPYVPVVTLPEGWTVDHPEAREALARGFDAVADALGARVAGYPQTGDRRFVSADGRTTFAVVFTGPAEDGSPPGGGLGEVPDEAPAIERVLRAALPAGATVRVTGLDTLATGVDAGGLNVPLKITVAALAAVVVLLLVFRSVLAFVPLLTAVVAVAVAFLVLLGLSLLTELHDSALTMMPLLGLGIAIDYALLVVTRWREERARGATGDVAVVRAMRTAGHAVLFSGAAVAVGLVTMALLPIPFLRSLGLAGMVIAAVSVLVSLSLLPVVLATVGRRLDRRPLDSPGRGWSAWARLVVRHRRLAAGLAAGLLLALAVAGLGVDLSLPESRNLATSGPGHEGLAALRAAGLPSGALSAFDVFVPAGTDPDRVAERLRGDPGVHAVAAPHAPEWRRDGSAVLTVVPVAETGSPAGAQTLDRVREAVPDGTLVGGSAAQTADYVETTYRAFPLVLALISLVTLVMLARAFRSLLLPLKAVALNLLSLGAVVGALVVLWQWGWGTEALLGIAPNGTVGTFVPVTVFAFLYGLSMDYEVFILSRMREEYDRTGSTRQAVVRGLARTGRLTTLAALILFLSFASMAGGGEFDVAVFATGMGLGILLDATLIRAILLPATVAMLGRWNWWLPRWAATLLRVAPSPVRPERGPAPRTVPVSASSAVRT